MDDEDVEDLYFSEREDGPVPAERDVIDRNVWLGLRRLILEKVDGDWTTAFGGRARAEVPRVEWFGQYENPPLPETPAILDALEFCVRHYFGERASDEIRAGVNRIFRRNGLKFRLEGRDARRLL